MKKTLFVLLFLAIGVAPAFAKDTYVRGYMRRDGTYVQPYTRSSPDAYKSNNYGSKSSDRNGSSSWGYSSPYNRDSDRDGISNQFDWDDDNDGRADDSE